MINKSEINIIYSEFSCSFKKIHKVILLFLPNLIDYFRWCIVLNSILKCPKISSCIDWAFISLEYNKPLKISKINYICTNISLDLRDRSFIDLVCDRSILKCFLKLCNILLSYLLRIELYNSFFIKTHHKIQPHLSIKTLSEHIIMMNI